MTSRYINIDGSLSEASQPVLLSSNRAFRYGDALFETIRLMHGEILFLEKHLERLKQGIQIMGMNLSKELSFQKIYLLIRHLDQVNQLGGNGRIRLEVFRQEGGYYTPHNSETSFLIESEPLEKKDYRLNTIGLKVDFYQEIKRHPDKLSPLKTSNSLPFIMAAVHKKRHGLDDCIMLNTENHIAEAISSNIFMVKKNEIFTPSIDQGCIRGVMRQVIIEKLKSEKIQVHEKKITMQELLNADEIFFTDVINGIRWVGAIQQHRYFNKFSNSLLQMVSHSLAVEK